MNFLAHCALARAHDDLIVGGFLGDFVKGPVPAQLPGLIGAGIQLHRRIDAFSNTQPDLRVSIERLPAQQRRLAPPFVDLLADHFLARKFEHHHGESLETFTHRVHAVLDERRDQLNGRATRFLAFMQDAQLFLQYQSLDAVEGAFLRIAMRLKRPQAVAPMMDAVAAQYDALAADFERYYPSLAAHADDWMQARSLISAEPRSC
ncbi:MAG: DUF479 domain-containing protein [Gammaproteobacteria bacterium]|nr:DUF479 domain-containing protein [Gammaproteobacteria bacterium]